MAAAQQELSTTHHFRAESDTRAPRGEHHPRGTGARTVSSLCGEQGPDVCPRLTRAGPQTQKTSCYKDLLAKVSVGRSEPGGKLCSPRAGCLCSSSTRCRAVNSPPLHPALSRVTCECPASTSPVPTAPTQTFTQVLAWRKLMLYSRKICLQRINVTICLSLISAMCMCPGLAD